MRSDMRLCSRPSFESQKVPALVPLGDAVSRDPLVGRGWVHCTTSPVSGYVCLVVLVEIVLHPPGRRDEKLGRLRRQVDEKPELAGVLLGCARPSLPCVCLPVARSPRLHVHAFRRACACSHSEVVGGSSTRLANDIGPASLQLAHGEFDALLRYVSARHAVIVVDQYPLGKRSSLFVRNVLLREDSHKVQSRSTDVLSTDSIEDELDAPWVHLEYLGKGGSVVRAKSLDNIEDAGRTEDRIRHDYTGRYPLELLQNAHDACADAKRLGAVRFAVTPSALLVANEGVPFTQERIRSIVRLGSSEKVQHRNERRTIGYKGVGFTAVFEITDRPQIISSTAAFEFDRRRAQREVKRALGTAPSDIPARGFPFRLTDEAWAEDADVVRSFLEAGAVTVIRLPLRAHRTSIDIAQHVTETILPEVLLFMPYVNEIEVVLPEGSAGWKRTAGRRVGAGRVMHLRGADGTVRSWLVATTSFRVSKRLIEALEDPLWSGVRELSAATAVPWRKGPYPEAGAQRLHVYFPTDDELGRALLIHGDFYIDSGRRHIESRGPGGDVSRAVAAVAARLAATVAESVANRGGRQLLECLAKQDHSDGFGETMGQLLEDALRNARIARPADGSEPRRPSTLKRLGMSSTKREQRLLPLIRPSTDLVRTHFSLSS